MTLVESQDDLRENPPNEVFSNVLASIPLAALLDQLGQVTSLTVLHDQINWSVLFVDEFVVAAHDVVGLDLAQDLHLVVQLLLLFLAHAPVIGHFPDHLLVAWYV